METKEYITNLFNSLYVFIFSLFQCSPGRMYHINNESWKGHVKEFLLTMPYIDYEYVKGLELNHYCLKISEMEYWYLLSEGYRKIENNKLQIPFRKKVRDSAKIYLDFPDMG